MKKKNKKVNAAILIIGNEILSGRTTDQNVSYLASWLNNNLGIKIGEVRIVPEKPTATKVLIPSKAIDLRFLDVPEVLDVQVIPS